MAGGEWGEALIPAYDSAGIVLYHGDCLAVLPTLPDRSFDAIIADPPYGTTGCAWDSVIPFAPMWGQLRRLIKPRGAIVLFGSEPFSSLLRASNIKQYRFDWIWDKGRGFNPQLANVQPMKCHENISVFAQKGHAYYPQKTPLKHILIDRRGRSSEQPNRKNGGGHQLFASPRQDTTYTDRYPESILYFPAIGQTLRRHDTEKPVELMEYLILTYTNPGDTVLDFTAGSGTTLRAAKNLNRRAVGIEISETYCQVTAQRLGQEVMELAV